LRWARALISIRPDGSRTARNTFDVNNHDGLKKKEKRKKEPPLCYSWLKLLLFFLPPDRPNRRNMMDEIQRRAARGIIVGCSTSTTPTTTTLKMFSFYRLTCCSPFDIMARSSFLINSFSTDADDSGAKLPKSKTSSRSFSNFTSSDDKAEEISTLQPHNSSNVSNREISSIGPTNNTLVEVVEINHNQIQN
jgi:hypothetical protein